MLPDLNACSGLITKLAFKLQRAYRAFFCADDQVLLYIVRAQSADEMTFLSFIQGTFHRLGRNATAK